jgi:ferredoxin
MSRNILKKGMTIIGWNDWYGSDFMSPHARVPDGEWGHPDEIDLAEAEAFGRHMAKNSIRIYSGEKNLIPRIPTPGKGENSLWSPRVNDLGNITFASPPPNSIPEFDFTKCVYPRCSQCIENCPVQAIDFSVTMSAGSIVPLSSTISSPVVLKEACQHCGGLCERVCRYDAISYAGEKIKLVVNMTKCTYPKCTECIDNCPQDSIDFSVNPPVIHNHCEAAGLCWGVCPENAIEVPNMAEVQLKKGWWFRNRSFGPQPQAGEAEKVPAGGHPSLPKFRPLIRDEDIGTKGMVMFFTEYPRVPIKKELWPYDVDEG